MDINTLAPVIGAILLGAFRLAAYYLRIRAIMTATPEQRAALDKIEPPTFLRSSGPALALLTWGGIMAGRAHLASPERFAKKAPVGDFQADLRHRGLPLREADHVQD